MVRVIMIIIINNINNKNNGEYLLIRDVGMELN